MKQKIAKITLSIFKYGISILMLTALLIALTYIFAFIIGGETAATIDEFMFSKILPIIYVLGVLMSVIGIAHLYLTKYKGFRFGFHK